MNQISTAAAAATNYIIENLTKRNVRDLTNLKLQKLLYFAYGIHLYLFDERLFEDEIQAWDLGPVIPSIYYEFKDHGKNNPIGLNVRARILEEGDFSGELSDPKIRETEEEKIQSLYLTCVVYGDRQAWDLVDDLHNGSSSAWAKAYKKEKKGIKIVDDLIKEEFKSRDNELKTTLLG